MKKLTASDIRLETIITEHIDTTNCMRGVRLIDLSFTDIYRFWRAGLILDIDPFYEFVEDTLMGYFNHDDIIFSGVYFATPNRFVITGVKWVHKSGWEIWDLYDCIAVTIVEDTQDSKILANRELEIFAVFHEGDHNDLRLYGIDDHTDIETWDKYCKDYYRRLGH